MLSPPFGGGRTGLCGFSQVQFETYLLWVRLMIPFSKMSGECSLETEREKQNNMERRLYFSLQNLFMAVSCDRAATPPTRSKNPIWGLNSTSEIATCSWRLPERMIFLKSCWSNNRVPGCSGHKLEEINSKHAKEKKITYQQAVREMPRGPAALWANPNYYNGFISWRPFHTVTTAKT